MSPLKSNFCKERPILMNGAMVRATLDGTKTQTRRIVKPQPRMYEPGQCVGVSDMINDALVCPYGKAGDRLWVGEAFAKTAVCQAPGQEWVVYREYDNRTDYGGPWKPSIHKLRAASRILLEIVSVRVERLQDITLGGICNEGLARSIYEFRPANDGFRVWTELWEAINGVGSWAADPWVWVIEFKRVAP